MACNNLVRSGQVPLHPWPDHDLRPIVIGGCARSGTTLLLSILSSHPAIYAIPFETQTLCPTAYSRTPKWKTRIESGKLGEHLADASIPPGCQYWCEKTPKNVLFFRKIRKHFGKTARLIHVVRDGRDVVCSVHPDDPTRRWVSPERWVNEVRIGKSFERHRQVLTVRYEDLVTDYEATTAEVLKFLNLDSCGQLSDYPLHATVQTSNAWFEPARPVHAHSIGRWRDEEHRQVVDELVAQRRAVRLLRHYRYL